VVLTITSLADQFERSQSVKTPKRVANLVRANG
jgi:hypothetical protein